MVEELKTARLHVATGADLAARARDAVIEPIVALRRSLSVKKDPVTDKDLERLLDIARNQLGAFHEWAAYPGHITAHWEHDGEVFRVGSFPEEQWRRLDTKQETTPLKVGETYTTSGPDDDPQYHLWNLYWFRDRLYRAEQDLSAIEVQSLVTIAVRRGELR